MMAFWRDLKCRCGGRAVKYGESLLLCWGDFADDDMVSPVQAGIFSALLYEPFLTCIRYPGRTLAVQHSTDKCSTALTSAHRQVQAFVHTRWTGVCLKQALRHSADSL